jgi:hypothetical protein
MADELRWLLGQKSQKDNLGVMLWGSQAAG